MKDLTNEEWKVIHEKLAQEDLTKMFNPFVGMDAQEILDSIK